VQINIFLNSLLQIPKLKAIFDRDVKYSNLSDIINSIYLYKNKIKVVDITNFKLLKPDISYTNIPHMIRRLYKITMNILFTEQQIDEFKGGGISQSIINFRLYGAQDKNAHVFTDCKKYFYLYDMPQYKYSIIDTINIFVILNSTKSNDNKIIELFNYLINNTYYINILYTDKKTDFNISYNNYFVENRFLKLGKINKYKCMSGVGSLIKNGFKITLDKLDNIFNKFDTNNNILNESSKNKYFYKYLKYKYKYHNLKKYLL
jgi:hypothetical protein